MKRLRKTILIIVFIGMICSAKAAPAGSLDSGGNTQFYGSFTSEKTYSYDGHYYALQTVENSHKAGTLGAGEIKVTVYLAGTDEPISSFVPARAWDFWGICWERTAISSGRNLPISGYTDTNTGKSNGSST